MCENNIPHKAALINFDIICTDDGYKLIQTYEENEQGYIIPTKDSLLHFPDRNEILDCNSCSHNMFEGLMCSRGCDIFDKLMNAKPHEHFFTSCVKHCEARDIILKLNLIKSFDDMIKFIERVVYRFDSVEQYEDYFGFERPYDDDGIITETVAQYVARGGKFENIPPCYPAVIYFNEHAESLEWICLQ